MSTAKEFMRLSNKQVLAVISQWQRFAVVTSRQFVWSVCHALTQLRRNHAMFVQLGSAHMMTRASQCHGANVTSGVHVLLAARRQSSVVLYIWLRLQHRLVNIYGACLTTLTYINRTVLASSSLAVFKFPLDGQTTRQIERNPTGTQTIFVIVSRSSKTSL